jgi:uncharacterized protein (DUF608 family)
MTNRNSQQKSSISRREFISTSAAGACALPLVAGPFTASSWATTAEDNKHYIPVDKKLSSAWVEQLFARGVPKRYAAEEINVLGMPVGGVASGQLYVTGDGTLACWWLYNRRHMTGAGQFCYQAPQLPGMRLPHGFAIRVKPQGSGALQRTLDKSGFPGVTFTGQYPINTILYNDPKFPADIQLQAYSPFIPLNARDSALPATVLEYTVTNTSKQDMEVSLAGWLQNPVGILSRDEGAIGRLSHKVVNKNGTTRIQYKSLPALPEQLSKDRPPEVFADFEGDDYGDWKVEGEAFGKAPARGNLRGQRKVRGFQGERLANSFHGGDKSKGRLVSPTFKIKRPYINFLFGGGRELRHRLMISLVVGGKRTAFTQSLTRHDKLTWKFWCVKEYIGQEAHIEILDNRTGRWGHISIDQIEFADRPRGQEGDFTEQTDYGTATLCLLEKAEGASANLPADVTVDQLFGKKGGIFGSDTPQETTYELEERHCGALGKSFRLRPRESRKLRFLLTWHFPTHLLDFNMPESKNIGNYYATMHPNAGAVADYVHGNFERLEKYTRRYHEVFYQDSTLPHWLLERIGHTPSILATGTVQWRANGRFWGWEGVGCCAGTCTHVWNYEHALARLFPELERTCREMQDFKPEAGLQPNGLVAFRAESASPTSYAADGQCGTVLKAWREHLISPDNSFLKRNWPTIKKILQYAIGRDANADGLIEDSQHNTYDINFFGANTMIGSLYLGALRAGEEMARIMGDDKFAESCRKIFESGSRLSVERLYDGEYFIQETDWEKHPTFQYGKGCLADQLFGQGWAHQVGLGYLYPKDKVQSALRSVYRYNWAPDIGPQNAGHAPRRWFARAGNAGLFTCTWPKSMYPNMIEGRQGVRYKNEIWTGIEYQVAGHMIYEGLLQEALTIIRGIHERHDGMKHNPYNEVECGDHYARALASWGCLLALSGFEYDGPNATLGFDPHMQPENFKAFFSGAEGWGSLSQKQESSSRTYTIELAYGKLPLKQLKLNCEGIGGATTISKNGKTLPVKLNRTGGEMILEFKNLLLAENDKLEVKINKA